MTTKEKAEELVFKYRLTDMNPQDFTDFDFNLSVSNSKQCALICVDEILMSQHNVWENTIEYWQDVKLEINKL